MLTQCGTELNPLASHHDTTRLAAYYPTRSQTNKNPILGSIHDIFSRSHFYQIFSIIAFTGIYRKELSQVLLKKIGLRDSCPE